MINVIRYAKAIKQILRNPLAWAGVAFDPQAAGAFYSNVIPDESGFLRACRVALTISTIETF